MFEQKIFPFLAMNGGNSSTDLMPYVPLKLLRDINAVDTFGLLDTGAMINVLPYRIGLELGADWNEQMPLFQLGGNLGNYESKGLILDIEIEDLDSVKLAFAWTKAENVPVILGQTNFFQSFDVCFRREDKEFEIKSR